MRGCWNRQTGKLEVLVSVLACGFKSHFPHQCKGHSIFRVSFIFISGKSANYYHQKQARWNRTKSLILWKRNLFRRLTKASPRRPSQYWRVGSSPISRTSVKDIRFSNVLYFYIRQKRESFNTFIYRIYSFLNSSLFLLISGAKAP